MINECPRALLPRAKRHCRKEAGPMLERGSSRASGRSSGSRYWLVIKHEGSRTEVLTIALAGGGKALPVFSFREEAELFLRFGKPGCGWRLRKSGAEELVSVFCEAHAGIGCVALDPLPQMVAEKTVGLVSLDWKRFMDLVVRAEGGPRRNNDRGAAQE